MSKQEELDYIEFKMHRAITVLFKDFLKILEDLREDGNIGDEDFGVLRNMVLTKGNRTIRGLKRKIEEMDL